MSATARFPDFLVIGAGKAGTTAMFGALSRHPRVFGSASKEPRFFAYPGTRPEFPGPGGEEGARKIVSDEAAYKELFARCPPDALAFEASAEYLYSRRAPVEASRRIPRLRLVAVLRHPVERGYSQYLHLRQEGRESLRAFEQAWAAEDDRIAAGWPPMWHYRSRGFYGEQLSRWLEHFPAEQLLVVFYDDWLRRPQHVLGRIWEHLGLDPVADPEIRRENVSSRQPRWPWLHHRMVEDNSLRRWAARRLPLPVRDAITHTLTSLNLTQGPRLDPTLRSRLAAVYHDDLATVEALTGRDLAGWRT